MKRLFAALSLALLVSLVVGAGVASASHGIDYAYGTVVEGGDEWRFAAKSKFDGDKPRGIVRVTFDNADPGLVITADVTCLRVMDGLFEARAVVTNVENGTTKIKSLILHGSDTPDTFAHIQTSLENPGPCALPTSGSPVQDGEVIVHDS